MSLYQQVFQGESFTEQNYFEAVRYVLGPEYESYPEDLLENELISRVNQMSESEAENFWSSLGNVAKNIGSGLLSGVSALAPIAGSVIGGVYGMPQVGSVVGGLVGNLAGAAGGALSNVNIPNEPRRNPPPPRRNIRQHQPQRRFQPNQNAGFQPQPNQNPGFQQNQNGRFQPNQNGGNQDLGQTLQNTANYLVNAGRAVLPAVQQYVQDNPVPLSPQTQQNVNTMQNLYNQLGGIINNPQFQAGQAQQSLGTASPNAPIESVSYAELVESLNYLTENILYEYYNEGYLPTEDYYINEYGQLNGSYSPQHVNRLHSILTTV